MRKKLLRVGVLSGLILAVLGWFTLSESSQPSAPVKNIASPSQQTPNQPMPKPDSFPATSQEETGDLRPLTTLEVVRLSDRIIFARCRNVEVREVEGKNIFTFSEFEVLQVVKGKQPEKSLTLRLLGGRIGDVEVDSPVMPKFSPGEEVILFLGKNNAEGYPTIFPQGIFRVLTQPVSGEKIVAPMPTAITLFKAKNNQRYTDRPRNLPLEDFLFSLSKLD